VETIATSDHVAAKLVARALVSEPKNRLVLEPDRLDVLDLEQKRAAIEPGANQILYQLVLTIDGDRLPAGQVTEIDSVTLSVEAKLDSAMHEPLSLNAVADTRFDQQLHRALLEDPRPDTVLYVFAILGLKNDGLDALQGEQMCEYETRGPGPHDSDLGPHRLFGARQFSAAPGITS
jgi:hypothetical protein